MILVKKAMSIVVVISRRVLEIVTRRALISRLSKISRNRKARPKSNN